MDQGGGESCPSHGSATKADIHPTATVEKLPSFIVTQWILRTDSEGHDELWTEAHVWIFIWRRRGASNS